MIRWGIIGPGTIAQNFADGLAGSQSGRLVAIASRSPERRAAFGDRHGIDPDHRHSDYAALVGDGLVDAVYVATPNALHRRHTLLALAAGKPVLCEKPMGLNAGEVRAMVAAAHAAGLFLMEAFMYRLHPQIARLVEVVQSGEIGQPTHLRAAFGFDAGPTPPAILMDPAMGGGTILDVGCYPMSLARLAAGLARGTGFAEPERLRATGTMGPTGVDLTTRATLDFPGGFRASIATSVVEEMDNSATLTGSRGAITLDDPWTPGRDAGPSDARLHITVAGETRTEVLRDPRHLFTFEAEAASRAIRDGATEPVWPAVTHADSIGNAAALDRWRAAVADDAG